MTQLEFAIEPPSFQSSNYRGRKWSLSPHSGRWWQDVLVLAFIASLDIHIVPSIVGSWFSIDLIIAWLIVTFVVAPLRLSFLLCVLGSLMIELSTNSPRGLYFTVLWMCLSTIVLIRRNLSWSSLTPWIVTFLVCGATISNLESVFVFLKQDSFQLNFDYFLRQLFRIGCLIVIGIPLAVPWMRKFQGDWVTRQNQEMSPLPADRQVPV